LRNARDATVLGGSRGRSRFHGRAILSGSRRECCNHVRLSHKAVSEKLLHARGSTREGSRARRRGDEPPACDGLDGRFRRPPLETIQRARRGFMRQPRVNAAAIVWKRCGSDKPQQSAADTCGASLAERAERQAALDGSRSSRLTSSRSPVRAGTAHRQESAFEAEARQFEPRRRIFEQTLVEASWKRVACWRRLCERPEFLDGPPAVSASPGPTPGLTRAAA
jgi:hypothetical protein